MSYVQRQDGESFEAMLSRFRKKLSDGGVLHEYRTKQHFLSPTESRQHKDRAAGLKVRAAHRKRANA